MSVGTKGVSRGTVTSAVLHPTFSDSFGSYFNITCGNISGQFCITKFKKNQTKCIYVNGKWLSPSEIESLASKKAR